MSIYVKYFVSWVSVSLTWNDKMAEYNTERWPVPTVNSCALNSEQSPQPSRGFIALHVCITCSSYGVFFEKEALCLQTLSLPLFHSFTHLHPPFSFTTSTSIYLSLSLSLSLSLIKHTFCTLVILYFLPCHYIQCTWFKKSLFTWNDHLKWHLTLHVLPTSLRKAIKKSLMVETCAEFSSTSNNTTTKTKAVTALDMFDRGF